MTYGLASLALRTTSAGQVRDGIQRAREMVATRGRSATASDDDVATDQVTVG